MSKLKIGFVLDDGLDSADGVQQYVLTLGRYLLGRGHEVHYIAGETKRSDVKNIHSMSKNLRVRFNANSLSSPLPASSRKISELLNQEKFDILHVQIPYSPLMAAKVVSKAPTTTAVVGTFHILPYGQLQKMAIYLLGFILRLNSRRFDKVFAVSEPAANLSERAFGLPAEILPNVVDIKTMRAKRKKFGGKTLEIVFLGRLVKRKGCLNLIKALKIVEEKKLISSSYTVKIGGTGPDKKAMKKLIGSYGLNDRVELNGFIDEKAKPAFLAEADIAVFPSLGGESFGIVLIEAMAAGARAVVGGNNQGYAQVLNDVRECLVDGSDPSKIAHKLAELANDPSLRRKIHDRQQKIVKRYDIETVGPQLEKIYQELVKKRELEQNY